MNRSASLRLLRPGPVIVAVLLGALSAPSDLHAQTPAGSITERVVVDNDTIRVSVLTFPPGTASGRHVGLEPELGIVVAGELTLLTPEGREVVRAGEARWLPALVPHDARNEGVQPLTLWVILVKK